jgi:hypothetical protein
MLKITSWQSMIGPILSDYAKLLVGEDSKGEVAMTATKVGRLAQRREGGFWNAYWVPQQHTMDGALLVGSIRLSVKGRFREDFIALMQAAFSARSGSA